MNERTSTAAEIAGGIMVCVGVWLVYPAAALIVAGCALVAAGFALGADR